MNKSLIILKLGGAAITDKNKKQTLRQEVIDNVLEEVSICSQPMIIVHGAGSFAHTYAKEYNLRNGFSEEIGLEKQVEGIAKIRTSMQQLHLAILNAASLNNIHTFSLPVSSTLISDGQHDIDSHFFSTYLHALENGFVPVTYGDMSFDITSRYRVISGDRIIQLLASFLSDYSIRVIFGSNVSGLFDKDPKYTDAKLIEEIKLDQIDEYIKIAGSSAGVDVTGGMKGKLLQIKEISNYAERIDIIDITKRNRLRDLLMGKEVMGTKIIK